jgi:signal transduction histidine kinase
VSNEVRTLPPVMRRDVQMLFAIGAMFSVLGGVLQELHRIEGPGSIPSILKQVGSNLIVTVTTTAVVLLICWIMAQRSRSRRFSLTELWSAEGSIPLWTTVVGGAVGGVIASLVTRGLVDPILVVTSAVWMLIAGVLVRTIGTASRRVNTQAVELSEAVVQLQSSRIQLVEADVEVRRQIAEYLHGSVQADLIGLERQAQLNGNPELAARLKECRVGIVRDVSHQLHPLVIDVGLVPALDELIVRSPVPATLKVTPEVLSLDDFGAPLLPMRTRFAVYRVVQEGLLNACTAGRARNASVTLARDDGDLRIAVEDDGVGVPVTVKRGVGLQSIDAWVGGLGGTWSLDARVEGGTTLAVTLPIEAVKG